MNLKVVILSFLIGLFSGLMIHFFNNLDIFQTVFNSIILTLFSFIALNGYVMAQCKEKYILYLIFSSFIIILIFYTSFLFNILYDTKHLSSSEIILRLFVFWFYQIVFTVSLRGVVKILKYFNFETNLIFIILFFGILFFQMLIYINLLAP